MLGDFNEWIARPGDAALLSERCKSVDLRHLPGARRTYPGLFPMLHLDHIYFDGAIEFVRSSSPRNAPLAIASDHLPLVADIVL